MQRNCRVTVVPAQMPAAEVLKRQGVEIAGMGDYLRLQPHLHDTDGFFAAVMERDK